MSCVTFLGKFLIVASIAFEAYLFFTDKQAIAAFDKQLSQALSGCDCIPPNIQALIKEYLRLAVAGLLASSVLMLVCRCWSLKLPTLLGLGLLLWVEHHEVFRRIPTLALLENTALWHSLGLLGALIYLMGAECTKCDAKCTKEECKGKEEAVRESKEEKGKKKRN